MADENKTEFELEKPKSKSRAAYFREYRKKNKQKLRDYQNKRNAETPERKALYNKAYREKAKLKKRNTYKQDSEQGNPAT